MATHRTLRHSKTRSDLARRQLLPIRQHNHGTLANTEPHHCAQYLRPVLDRVSNPTINHPQVPRPPALPIPMRIRRLVQHRPIQIRPLIDNGLPRIGRQNPEHRLRHNIRPIGTPHKPHRKPHQVIPILPVDLFVSEMLSGHQVAPRSFHNTMTPPTPLPGDTQSKNLPNDTRSAANRTHPTT
jgi:hypothetical protein